MKSILLTTLSLFLLVLISPPTFAADEKAGVVIPIGVMATSSTITQGTSSTTSYLWLDPHAGYKFSNGLYLGASYYYNVDTGGGNPTATTTWYAPEVGYMTNGWFVRVGYVPGVASQAFSETGSPSNDSGSGFYGDVGYEAMLSEHIGIGAYLKYYSITFTKQTFSGTQSNLSPNMTVSQFLPMAMVSFHL